jgi:hypothetical protein
MYEYRLGTTVFTDCLPRSPVKGYTDVIVCRNGTRCVSVVDKIHCFPPLNDHTFVQPCGHDSREHDIEPRRFGPLQTDLLLRAGPILPTTGFRESPEKPYRPMD